MRTLRPFVVLLLWAAVFCLGVATSAKDAKERKVGYALRANALSVTFGYRDVLNERVKERLRSGLPNRIVLQVSVLDEKNRTVAYFARTVQIVYDLWEENFIVTVREPGRSRSLRLDTVDEVANVSCAVRRLAVASDLPPGTYRLQVMAEANPVSEEMVRNIQRWMSRPSATPGGHGGTANYFGSFVGYFVDRDIGQADRTVRFVSQRLAP